MSSGVQSFRELFRDDSLKYDLDTLIIGSQKLNERMTSQNSKLVLNEDGNMLSRVAWLF